MRLLLDDCDDDDDDEDEEDDDDGVGVSDDIREELVFKAAWKFRTNAFAVIWVAL